ncbi:MAG: helix-turn-helix domain-containing protein [Acidobacteriota bacterium]|nr:MAG: helix-turn-helix domain-containing protein [Acidobacteriota bacterium]
MGRRARRRAARAEAQAASGGNVPAARETRPFASGSRDRSDSSSATRGPSASPSGGRDERGGSTGGAGDGRSGRSFGALIRRERELRGVSLREVSESTKINVRYLEALERNEFTYLPGGAFTKGFIRAYARSIGADESAMIDAYLFELAQQERGEGESRRAETSSTYADLARHFQVRAGGEEVRRRRLRWLVVGVVAVALALLLLGGLWFGLRAMSEPGTDEPPTRRVSQARQ